MPHKRHRVDFSVLRRRQVLSSASSSDLSPTVPVLESPISFHAMASHDVDEATLKQSRLNRDPVKPSMFFEDKEEDDLDGSVPNLRAGDRKVGRSPHAAQKSSGEEEPLAQPKSQFFEESFSARAPWGSPSARMSQDSLVVIELKVNTSVKDEDSVISKVTSRMAQIYQRSESLMVVTIQEVRSLRYGTSTEPAYTMKIFALPFLIAPITNLRSTILIQAALQDILHISPARGIILYVPVSEENMATNSTTMMGEIARLERDAHSRQATGGIFKSLSRTLRPRKKKTSSGISAPLSVATTSSWAAGSDTIEPRQAEAPESEGTNASASENYTRPDRSSGTLRSFVSRRMLERSGQSSSET
ncbi:Tautomerase/MIF superfamily [Aspergillus unguis]